MINIIGSDALVVVDMQKDFAFPEGALYVEGIGEEPSIEKVISNIEQLDSMPFGHKAMTLARHPDDSHIEFSIFPKHCVVTYEGSEIVDEVAHIVKDYECIVKGQHPAVIAYSVGTAPHFHTHINNLRLKGIRRVFVVGLAFDFCVGESAIDYKSQGFETYIILDAICLYKN